MSNDAEKPTEAVEDHGDFWVCNRWLTLPYSSSSEVPASQLMADLDAILDMDQNAKLKRGSYSLSDDYYLEYRVNKAAFERMPDALSKQGE